MIYTDMHAHTVFCDGKNTPEEMVLSAIEKGLKKIGLVIHSYLPFSDEGGCKGYHEEQAFIEEMQRLKEKYKDKIQVLCGIEMDYYSVNVTKGFDYMIGSVHFFKVDGKYYPIDWGFDLMKNAVDQAFGGDVYLAVEQYYSNVSNVLEKFPADIIGHIDLITKFNEIEPYIDVNNPRYIKAWQTAVDKLIPYNKPFEINTGAISRGYRTTPYPAPDILAYIKQKGGKLILSSDAHAVTGVANEYDKWKSLL